MVGNGAFSHKINCITIFFLILNLKGPLNCITCSRVTAILLNGGIFHFGQSGEASLLRVCYQRGLPRLVTYCDQFWPLIGLFDLRPFICVNVISFSKQHHELT